MAAMKTIGDRIRELRGDLGWSQTQLAHVAGVSQQLIGKLETGAAERTGRLVQIANALGTTAEYLATGDATVGERGPPQYAADPQREALLRIYDQLTPEGKDALTSVGDAIAKQFMKGSGKPRAS